MNEDNKIPFMKISDIKSRKTFATAMYKIAISIFIDILKQRDVYAYRTNQICMSKNALTAAGIYGALFNFLEGITFATNQPCDRNY